MRVTLPVFTLSALPLSPRIVQRHVVGLPSLEMPSVRNAGLDARAAGHYTSIAPPIDSRWRRSV